MRKLLIDFYEGKDVVAIARSLLGKMLVTNIDGDTTSGRIVETEAYAGITDKASHAYGGRRTIRTAPMYASGGVAYVYLCYGIHQMFNVITNAADIPEAILIRAVQPETGIERMLQRTGKASLDATLTRGPGNVAKALGIHTRHTGCSLTEDTISIFDDGYIVAPEDIGSSPRIGVAYAAEDALLPYRFYTRGNKYVSGRPKL